MNNECGKSRDTIERMAFGGASASAQAEVERHVASCASCRAYLEAMSRDEAALTDYARSFDSSIEQIECESVAAAKRGVPAVETNRPRMWRRGARLRIAIYAAAAAVLVAVIWGVNHYTGVFGDKPAFAEVKGKIVSAQSVSYHWVLKVEGEPEYQNDILATDAGLVRLTMGKTGIVSVYDWNEGIDLTVYPATKTATLNRWTGRKTGKGLFNAVKWIATLQNASSGKLIGREKLVGVDTNVFQVPVTDFSSIKIWADAETNLPVKVVWTLRSDPKLDVVAPALTLFVRDFGGTSSFGTVKSMGSQSGMTRNSENVFDDFKWNVNVDPALMSVTPPEGYHVQEIETDESLNGEKDLVSALSFWAEMSGKEFPASITDLCDPTKVRPFLIKKFDRNGDPQTEFKEALREVDVLLDALAFSQDFKGDGTWHYAGAGVKLGDKKSPVCWWKPEGSQKYRVLYGDLRLADVDEGDLPKKAR